jgi:hypothetical protein
MKHSWRGIRLKPNDVNGPAEHDEECQNCGAIGKTDENEFGDCPEVAWVIEKVGLDRPYYFTVYLGGMTYSADVNDAVRFARELDAGTMCDHKFFTEENVKPTEHILG